MPVNVMPSMMYFWLYRKIKTQGITAIVAAAINWFQEVWNAVINSCKPIDKVYLFCVLRQLKGKFGDKS